jgi:hypothetical protein
MLADAAFPVIVGVALGLAPVAALGLGITEVPFPSTVRTATFCHAPDYDGALEMSQGMNQNGETRPPKAQTPRGVTNALETLPGDPVVGKCSAAR